MSKVSVLTSSNYRQDIYLVSIECPFCHTRITPKYLLLDNEDLFSLCPNTECNAHFILRTDSKGYFNRVHPNYSPRKASFSTIIQETSSSFCEIYNQAFCAEQMGLNQICGVGYRKALEFIIKDYLLMNISDESKRDSIRKKFLGNCIKEDVSSTNIKEVAKRAVWLGNDETHYTRIWIEKDVSDLKHLIDLTIRWIENEIETQRLLASMPEQK